MALTLRKHTAAASRPCTKLAAPRIVRCNAAPKQEACQQEPVRPSPLLMAAMLALSGGLLAGDMVSPPAARADEGADRRKAEMARRKAILAASRAKAEADLSTPKKSTVAEADAAVDAANAERQRLAAERVAAIKTQRDAEYARQADRAVKEVPPV